MLEKKYNLLVNKNLATLFCLVLTLFVSAAANAAEKLKPFVLASNASGDYTQIIKDTKTKLSGAGFEIVGEYSPFEGRTVIVVTNNALKTNAKNSEFGAYGAIQRVAVADIDGAIQVSYTNPVYMANAYRMQGQLEDVDTALKAALGHLNVYGSEKGLTVKKLRKYHYMFSMPYFDDPDLLVKHDSYDQAIKAVEAGLAAGKGGTSKVYRVDLTGKKQSVFGVAMTKGMSSDFTVMEEVDFKPVRSVAHLPYELLVHEDGKVYALNAKFRIAINFPDLSMAGKNSFFGIIASPDAIKKALAQAAGSKKSDDD